jgi:hypothetical protein
MNILYLKINTHGIGNVYCNIIIILIWIIKCLKYDKLIVINYFNREDLFYDFCIPILNDKIELINKDSNRWKQELVKIITILDGDLILEKRISKKQMDPESLVKNIKLPENFSAYYSKLYNNDIYYYNSKTGACFWNLPISNNIATKCNTNNIMSLKQFLKLHFGKDIIKNLNNSNNVTDILFHYIYAKKEDLLIAKKYFDLQPNKLLTNNIEKLKKKMGNYISIHLRSTDLISHRRIVRRRLIKFFNFIKHHPDKNIYLATDCERNQRIFSEKYNNRVFFFEKISENYIGREVRNTSNISIYMDLFMCRDSLYFLGTPESTFTRLIKILRFNKQN